LKAVLKFLRYFARRFNSMLNARSGRILVSKMETSENLIASEKAKITRIWENQKEGLCSNRFR
jgi:hypothetical protein